MAKGRGGGGGSGRVFLGFVLGVLTAGLAAFACLHFGWLPTTAADKLLVREKRVAAPPWSAHAEHEKKTPPFGTSEDVFESGAHIYRAECAKCHGTPGHEGSSGKNMDPVALQLWKRRGQKGTVGVSGEEPGETYWKVANGIRLTGMPGYKHVLSDTQMWQVSLLLANADKQLPDPVRRILMDR